VKISRRTIQNTRTMAKKIASVTSKQYRNGASAHDKHLSPFDLTHSPRPIPSRLFRTTVCCVMRWGGTQVRTSADSPAGEINRPGFLLSRDFRAPLDMPRFPAMSAFGALHPVLQSRMRLWLQKGM